MDINSNDQKKLWFKAKRFGWGWTPASWQGWVLLVAYVGIIYGSASRIDARTHSGSDALINFAIIFIPVTVALIYISYKKGEKPKWHWNGKPVNTVNNDKEQK